MNVVLILADEHRRDAMGCAGNEIVRTPNLDSLAASGHYFGRAYCNSPLCVPSRASFVTGRYVHEIGCYDNAAWYTGTPRSWGHYLTENDVSVTTIGKLHFEVEGSGFDDAREVYPPARDEEAYRRDAVRVRPEGRRRLRESGPGDDHVAHTEAVTAEAERFLVQEAPEKERPWVLWVNYLVPHFPLVAPGRLFESYDMVDVGLPVDYPSANRHPALEELRRHFDGGGLDPDSLRRARQAYFALCTYLDEQVGRVVQAIDASPEAQETLVIYTSDHGEMLGDHELWWKNCMYEPAVGVPLIMRNPVSGTDSVTVGVPVSLLDVSATIIDAVGLPAPDGWRGESLLSRWYQDPTASRRPLFSEYHGHGTGYGMFMVRVDQWKYTCYPGAPEELFDVVTDPQELTNLANRGELAGVLDQMRKSLALIVDPEREQLRARADQERRSRLRYPVPERGM